MAALQARHRDADECTRAVTRWYCDWLFYSVYSVAKRHVFALFNVNF